MLCEIKLGLLVEIGIFWLLVKFGLFPSKFWLLFKFISAGEGKSPFLNGNVVLEVICNCLRIKNKNSYIIICA